MTLQLIMGTALMTLFISCGDVTSLEGKKNRPTSDKSNQGISVTSSLINSHLHRTAPAAALTYLEETEKVLAGTLDANSYRIVPDITVDDEAGSVTGRRMSRPAIACGTGTAFSGTTARIEDCTKKNTVNAVWNATAKGVAGEVNWQLVARTESAEEFWLDTRTGMIWSDRITVDNWCNASGNKQVSSEPKYFNCDANFQKSVCAGVKLEAVGDSVKWRLPTRNDYLQADLDGLRFVLPNKADAGTPFWTATVVNLETRIKAWAYNQYFGTLEAIDMGETISVRCIGAPRAK